MYEWMILILQNNSVEHWCHESWDHDLFKYKSEFYLQRLLTAAKDGNMEVVKLCLENDADIDYYSVRKKVTFWIALSVYQIILKPEQYHFLWYMYIRKRQTKIQLKKPNLPKKLSSLNINISKHTTPSYMTCCTYSVVKAPTVKSSCYVKQVHLHSISLKVETQTIRDVNYEGTPLNLL